jgi:hypothetical protein
MQVSIITQKRFGFQRSLGPTTNRQLLKSKTRLHLASSGLGEGHSASLMAASWIQILILNG